jgi:hypothetical protein
VTLASQVAGASLGRQFNLQSYTESVTFGNIWRKSFGAIWRIQDEIDKGARPEPVEGERTSVMTNRCGLCGETKKLTRTLCCVNLICDDEDKYVMFSYARNSCHRNHDRYTL